MLLEAANITGSHIVSALSGDEFLVVPTDGHTTIDFVCQSVDTHLIMLAPAAVLTAHAIVAKDATVKL